MTDPHSQTIKLFAGDAVRFSFHRTSADATPTDLSTRTLRFQIGRGHEQMTVEDAAMDKADAATGQVVITLTAANTEHLGAGTQPFGLKVITAGAEQTIAAGKVVVCPEIVEVV